MGSGAYWRVTRHTGALTHSPPAFAFLCFARGVMIWRLPQADIQRLKELGKMLEPLLPNDKGEWSTRDAEKLWRRILKDKNRIQAGYTVCRRIAKSPHH